MTLKLFLDVMSQPSRAVLIFCRAAQIPHEFEPVRLAKMQHRTPEFQALNPFQTVPVIDDGGFVVNESSAILRYLVATRPEVADHWYPRDPQGQARVDEYLHWQHLNTRAGCALYFQVKWVIPMMTQKTPSEAKVARHQKMMETALTKIQDVWLASGQKSYLLGDQISVADIMLSCELEQPGVAGYDVRDQRPVIADYMERVKRQLHPHYEDVHKVLEGMKTKFGGQAKL